MSTERIDAVEKALEKVLGDTGATQTDPVRSTKPPSAPDRVAPDLDSNDAPF